MASEEIQKAAKAWIDSTKYKWRLQILSRRTRTVKDDTSPTGYRSTDLPVRVRRFVEGIPHVLVDEAMKYLLTQAPYKDVIYNGIPLDGVYRPTLTVWQRDDNIVANGSKEKTDGTYTLVQDLIEMSDPDNVEVTSSLTCSEYTTTDWHWDEPDLPGVNSGLPTTGSPQGSTYSLQSVNRNEDGTFDYALVTKHAVSQHTGLYLSRATATESVYVESWDNLYGTPPDFVLGPTDVTTMPADVPTAVASFAPTEEQKEAGYDVVAGARVEVQVDRNDDCTYRVRAVYTKTTSANVSTPAVGSCSETTTYSYYWGSASLPSDLDSGPGYTVSIQSVHRNDDGTFDYVVVTRKAITQFSGWHVQTDNLSEKVETATWENAYKNVVSGGETFIGHDNQTMTDLAFPEIPSSGITGTQRIELQISENPDCTYKITAVRTTVKQMTLSVDSSHTQYEGDHSEGEQGRLTPLPNAPDATGGVIKSHESQRQPDGTYRTVEKVKVERPVEQSSVTVSVGRRGKRVVTVDTNQTAPASMEGIGVGGSVKVEKTPGRLYTNTVTTWDKTEKVTAAIACTEDLFHHRDSTTESGLSDFPVSPNDHVKDSGTGGHVKTLQVDMDEEGSISQTLVDDLEKKVPKSEESWTVGLTGVTHTVQHRNVKDSDAEYVSAGPSYSTANIGKQVRKEKTPGGLYNILVSELDRTTNTVTSGDGCSKTAFLHTDTASVNKTELGTDDTTCVDDAAKGVYREKDLRLNQDGSYTVTTSTHNEVEQRGSTVAYRRTPRGLVTTTVDRNVTDEGFKAPEEDEVGNSTSKELTNGKLYNITTTTLQASTKPDRAACAKTIFEHHEDEVTMSTGAVDTSHVVDAGNGIHRQKSSELDSDGFVRTTVRTVSELRVNDASEQYSTDRFLYTVKKTDKNLLPSDASTRLSNKPTATLSDANHVVTTLSASKNPGGSVDIVEETTVATYRNWDHEVDTNWRYSYTVWFQNASSSEKDNLYQTAYKKFSTHLSSKNAGDVDKGATTKCYDPGCRMPVSYSVSPNVTENKFGLYDGSFTFTATWDMDSAGQNGTTDLVFLDWQYTLRQCQASANASASSEGGASITSTITTMHVYNAIGRGRSKLHQLFSGYPFLYSGTSVQYNPVTQVWHMTLVTSCNIEITGTGT